MNKKLLSILILGILGMTCLSLYIKVKVKYPTTTDEYVINTDMSAYDKNCVDPGKVYNYFSISDNLLITELSFHTNCTSSPVAFVIKTGSNIINSYSVSHNDTILIKSNKTSDNVYRFWFNATNNRKTLQPHSVRIFTTTENLFSNRYRVVLQECKLSKVSLSYDEWEYFCESDCFLPFTSVKSQTPIGREGTMKFKQFIPDENTFLVGFYPSSTIWLFIEFLSFSLTAGLFLELIHVLMEGNSREKQKPETFSNNPNNSDRILGAFHTEEIKKLIEKREYLEAFLSIHNKIQWLLRAFVGFRFFPKYTPRNEIWELLEERMIDSFKTLQEICVKFKLIEDEDLKRKLTEFNEFRNKVVHNIYEKKITQKMLEEKCNLGLDLIEGMTEMKDQLWLDLQHEHGEI